MRAINAGPYTLSGLVRARWASACGRVNTTQFHGVQCSVARHRTQTSCAKSASWLKQLLLPHTDSRRNRMSASEKAKQQRDCGSLASSAFWISRRMRSWCVPSARARHWFSRRRHGRHLPKSLRVNETSKSASGRHFPHEKHLRNPLRTSFIAPHRNHNLKIRSSNEP